ncbi:MAG: phosphoribosylamine--glycine ligase [Nitrososphaerales archaeon]|nr:phosphoribosylamine--glycine ligase [Nitrososphaerales archaeon]
MLVIGGGGREHAICVSISNSNLLDKLYCVPGNPGIEDVATCIEGDIMNNDFILDVCKENSIDFVIVGPEAPLTNGVVDILNSEDIYVFGPDSKAAELEGSKIFMKDLCKKYEIPSSAYETFFDADSAISYLESQNMPIVVKANGLAAGKGVIIAHEKSEAIQAVNDMLINNKFGSAGDSIVIEEFLEGRETSFFIISDGNTVLPLGFAQDYKPIFEGNKGPNTGGMGSYSPVEYVDSNLEKEILSLAQKTIDSMNKEGRTYRGVLYVGLMLTENGPKILEYNVRFGDPECQVLLPRIKNDFLEILFLSSKGELDIVTDYELSDDSTICVVISSPGYPEKPITGSEIVIENNYNILHAGTKKKNNRLYSKGGRVLNILGKGSTLSLARDEAYKLINGITWKDMYYRRDIGLIENE